MDSETESLFRQTLTDDYESEASWQAVHRLRSLGTREIFETAAAWCVSDESRKRARGADILGQLGVSPEQPESPFANESFDILSRLLEEEKDPQPIAAAIASLGHLADTRALPLMIGFSTNLADNVRLALAFALGSFAGEPQAIRALIVLMQDKNGDVRNWAAFSLGNQGDADSEEIRDALATSLKDGNDEVQLEAAVGLAKRKDLRVLPKLLKALARKDVARGHIEAACHLLEMPEDRSDWKAEDYSRALRERFGEPVSASDK